MRGVPDVCAWGVAGASTFSTEITCSEEEACDTVSLERRGGSRMGSDDMLTGKDVVIGRVESATV